ncbi:pyridoxamine 5'-phosphate oxidase family protein [Nocardioides sp. Kera G14]|uniref:pyridoxamine 5'-phosphate oxidase family protein n=1 Tax=Nocardioides sp. Kera G14 TaxID=2884264 RepID=UPI001D1268A2|nr:pyridoxamine 5'-phosphate oxidase family protein [Nocardioides sp. Kera G14]UDY24845.1 pyridoxamine 5'-phosphate oxidase family protein [Nocardioides sp. Kera G14]
MAQLHEIDESECWDLLKSHSVSRVAWAGSDGPVVLPLNYVVHDGALWLRTSAHSTLSQEVDDAPVAILVDEFDAETQVGWSVQVRGTAQMHYKEESVPDEVQKLRTWAAGARPLWISVTPTALNGRRLAED